MVIATFEINDDGDLCGLYTDDVNLYEVGRLSEVRDASNVEFNHDKQVWEVVLPSGKVVHENKNRTLAIEWEKAHLAPGGDLWPLTLNAA